MNSSAPTAIVAEDEDTLRHELVEQLGRLWPELSIVAEASDGIETLRLHELHKPDLMFLDIQMPGLTGIEVARQVGARSHVVFVTAYDQYAVQAFDEGAVDYLLKPLQAARLFTAINRLKQRLAQPLADLSAVLDRLAAAPRLLETRTPRQPLRWINASVGQTLKLITVDEVLYFQSDNKYTRVAIREGEALIRKPLKELVEELDAQQFWQIHRSTLVNAAAIAGVTRDFRGRLQVRLKDSADVLLVAESYAHLFKQM
ncbi:LytR/AlgR family response regulator transcription factor [Paucibacter soli]|uniref:LytR/AlgR family response regulator transcription factor n=1 Tax=Paucibacter soli TaxID=3133433 RepID=UPI0030999F6B